MKANLILSEILVVRLYPPLPEIGSISRSQKGRAQPGSGLIPLFATRKEKLQGRMNRDNVECVTDKQPVSILLRTYIITFYIKR